MRIKQSTAVAISFGPFLDPTDGVTLVTGAVSAIDNGTTGIKLSKNGGALTIRHATVTASTYDGYGNYIVTLDTTDTNTLGTLRVQFCAAATTVPVWQDLEVVNANEWDSSFGTSVRKFSDLDQIKTVSQSATDLKDFADTGYDPATHKVAEVAVADSVATGGIAAASFAAGAIDNAAIAANAIGASELATDAVAEIANGLLDLADSIETGVTVRKVLRGYGAALLGKASGMATTTAVFRAADDSKTRITATVDADGNRSAVTLDLT